MTDRIRLTAAEGQSLGESAMRGIGFDAEEARILAAHVMDAALCGYEYSGLPKLLNIVDSPFWKAPRGPIRAVKETSVSLLLDGGNNVGMLAVYRATEAAIKEFEQKRADLEKAAAEKLAAAQALGEQLSGKTVRIAQKAGVDGRLFGSVTNVDIVEALGKMGLVIHKSQVRLPNGPLKTVGDHAVTVAPHTDVVAELTVSVYALAD